VVFNLLQKIENNNLICLEDKPPNCNSKIKLVKEKAILIHKVCQTPRQAWQATKKLIAGDSCHHSKPVAMKMKMKNGELARIYK